MCRRLLDRLAGARRDEGMTLIELSVAVGLLMVVLVMILNVLDSTESNFNRQVSRSTSNDQLRLAAESIDRDVRSGNVLYDPATENYAPGDVTPGMSLRIYTQSNSPTRGGATCVQWRITSSGQLQRRSWLESLTPVSSGWRIVATNITNRTDAIAAFTRSSSTQSDLINVDLRANGDPTGKKGSTVEVVESVTGRNTVEVANPVQPCGPATPDPTIQTTVPNFPIPSY